MSGRGNNGRPSIQSQLTEDTFREYLEGYGPVAPDALFECKGGLIRYAIDTVDAAGRVVATQYRLGGILVNVDKRLRYIRLLNPYATHANSQRVGTSWSVQLWRPAAERLRLWYMPPGSRDEIVVFRKMLQQMENGELKIVRTG